MNANLLVVEDEVDLREMLCFSLQRAGYSAQSAADGKSAWTQATDTPPNLILLDWMLPDVSGIELLRRLRREPRTATIPVIMLTARGTESDRVHGLDSGADDYLTKPFSSKELLARIRARLRASGQDADELIEYDGIKMDTGGHLVTVDGQPVDLGPTEYRLLHHFLASPGRVFSRSQLLDRVWGANCYLEERTVDVNIRRLRKVLENSGKDSLIQTVRGAGYRLGKR